MPKSKTCILCGRRHDHIQMERPPVYPGDYEAEALAKDWKYPRAASTRRTGGDR